ncbi:MAG: SRPBCC domain-containing protein [Bacteroidota bacterium]
MKETGEITNPPPRELTITRIFDAPRELVFKSWTDPARVAQWWGPRGFTNPLCVWEARPGGSIRVEMRPPDGEAHPMGGRFREIVSPERLVFTSTAFFDSNGNPQSENLNTVTFEEIAGGRTKVTLHVVVLKATAEMAGPLRGMKEGWSQSLDKLDEFISKK